MGLDILNQYNINSLIINMNPLKLQIYYKYRI